LLVIQRVLYLFLWPRIKKITYVIIYGIFSTLLKAEKNADMLIHNGSLSCKFMCIEEKTWTKIISTYILVSF
jgi:hypothetical protein